MTYLIRAAKYFLSLFVLSTLLITLLYALGMAAGTPGDMIHLLFFTPRGWFFLGAVLLLSLLYPRFGIMTALVAGDMVEHRDQITEAFRTEGFVPTDQSEGVVTYRASAITKRILLRFDDTITVRQQGSWIEMEGPRKVVARVEYQAESFIRGKNE